MKYMNMPVCGHGNGGNCIKITLSVYTLWPLIKSTPVLEILSFLYPIIIKLLKILRSEFCISHWRCCELTQRGALCDILLVSTENLVGEVPIGGHSCHGATKFKISGNRRKSACKPSTLATKGPYFRLLRERAGRAPGKRLWKMLGPSVLVTFGWKTPGGQGAKAQEGKVLLITETWGLEINLGFRRAVFDDVYCLTCLTIAVPARPWRWDWKECRGPDKKSFLPQTRWEECKAHRTVGDKRGSSDPKLAQSSTTICTVARRLKCMCRKEEVKSLSWWRHWKVHLPSSLWPPSNHQREAQREVQKDW